MLGTGSETEETMILGDPGQQAGRVLALLPFFMALHFSLWVVTCAGDDQPLDRQADGWTDRWAANPLSARKLLLPQLPSWTDSFFSASAGHSRGTGRSSCPSAAPWVARAGSRMKHHLRELTECWQECFSQFQVRSCQVS